MLRSGQEIVVGVGPIERFMTEDHARLDRLLSSCEGAGGWIDLARYEAFRGGLLRHIAMEEKVLLPDARARRGGAPLPVADKMRRDHGAIARLLASRPTAALLSRLRATLGAHNALEEGPAGLYAACDGLAAGDAEAIVQRLRAQPAVPLAGYRQPGTDRPSSRGRAP